MKYVSDNIKKLKGVSIENNKFILSRLEKAVPDDAKRLSSKVYDLMPNFVGQYNFDDNSNYDLINNMRPLQENKKNGYHFK